MSKEKSIYVVSNSLDWQASQKALLHSDSRESAAVLLCGVADGDSERRLLVRSIVDVPAELYKERNQYHLEISPRFYDQVITQCESSKLTPLIIHSHPFRGAARYSASDDYGESRLLPVLASLLPGRTLASLVITKDSVTGRRLLDERFVSLTGLKIFGVKTQIIDFSHDDHGSIPSEFDRQVRVFGESGQHLIQRIKVGIVGVGGIGVGLTAVGLGFGFGGGDGCKVGVAVSFCIVECVGVN